MNRIVCSFITEFYFAGISLYQFDALLKGDIEKVCAAIKNAVLFSSNNHRTGAAMSVL